MKSTATQPTPGGWNSPNTGATNSSGFTALPGGIRGDNGYFFNITDLASWWSYSIDHGGCGWYRILYRVLRHYDTNMGTANMYPSVGYSVRCLKDSALGGYSAVLPTVTTTLATDIYQTGATTGGNVTSDGGASITARGVAYGTVQNPTTANNTTCDFGGSTGVFTSTLTGLTVSTLYYVRAYATNNVGTSYGNEASFTTLAAPQPCPVTPTVTDIDGNVYNTVQIGTQCWTQSNLKVSKYRNGDNIPTWLTDSAWQTTTSGAYAIYNSTSSPDTISNHTILGKLYNHYAVTDSRGLCPTDWHVPSDAEWTTLENHLGGSSVAGRTLKSTTTLPTPGGWFPPNNSINSSGFTALPGGHRGDNGDFNYMSSRGFWWSSSVASGSSAWNCYLHHFYISLYTRSHYDRAFGFSVRCLKD
jgi:uncharacterized protein (TIGR02145 family)